MSGRKAADLIKYIADSLKTTGFDNVLKKIQIVTIENGNCVAEFTVSDEHLNRNGFLHGGFTATLVDSITTYALISKGSHPGVSVDLTVSYIKGAKKGDEITVTGKTVKAGKTLAFIECLLRDKNNQAVIAKGWQTKFVPFEKKVNV